MKKTDRYEKLKESIGGLGYILKGTITERIIEKEKTYGPYYQWTFKRQGKTVTVNLSKEQLSVYSKAIRNYKKLKATLKEMEKLSLEILEESTKGVVRRKNKNPLS